MGYNGGINKRGYYRRENGMMSKSSVRSGTKIVSDVIFGGISVISTLESTLKNATNNLPENILHEEISSIESQRIVSNSRHFDLSEQRNDIFLFAIFAMFCPVFGFVTYAYMSWWMTFSIIVFGLIEFILCMHLPIVNVGMDDKHYYIYDNELQCVERGFNDNLKIIRILLIVLSILDTYPLVLFLLPFDHKYNWMPETIIPLILILVKLFINGELIVEAFRKKIDISRYVKVYPQTMRKYLSGKENKGINKQPMFRLRTMSDLYSDWEKDELNKI